MLDQSEGAVLWHCSMGKDRAGYATALVLWCLDVPFDSILEDYEYTNTCMAAWVDKALVPFSACIDENERPTIEPIVRSMFVADPAFLMMQFDLMREISGSVDAYMRDELGIGLDERRVLQERYLA